ncbi:redox-regulated ATPase YchF [Candidatus Phytoplasma phoenicium]|uniref:Ribosome-binding ATPase YchF n=1 Tax=Candidatus Phytoplasma phoenicium TaxID=198422 RepID=A0A0L0MJ71_9MOLU|nr:redox-regulated ATPase YchF [Candidatus Phytoplasma phoenicium]KND62692.1 GTP-binding and nucleic acid-binding protein YchF [Candidatus Phytoplasma phoenicium]
MKVGIIGLPNVGKSTLFNVITNLQVLEANYPFATIQPNLGTVSVPEPRLNYLAQIFLSKKTIPTQIQFIDIAGLVKNASKGEGLGNKFLSHIRDVDAICHVVKCFDNPNIIHVNKQINPVEDSNIIETELILSDLEQIEKRLNKINQQKKRIKSKETEIEIQLLNQLKTALESEKSLSYLNFNLEELKIIKNFNLLSFKPMIYIGNFEEKNLNNLKNNIFFQQMKLYSQKKNREFLPVCVLLEKKITSLKQKEQKTILQFYNIQESSLKEIIQKSYELLGLKTYFTTGEKETKAWAFTKGMTAPECASLIHTDFQHGFIKAKIFNYEDLIKYPNLAKLKEKGKIRFESKNYIVQDGDIINFYFNV